MALAHFLTYIFNFYFNLTHFIFACALFGWPLCCWCWQTSGCNSVMLLVLTNVG